MRAGICHDNRPRPLKMAVSIAFADGQELEIAWRGGGGGGGGTLGIASFSGFVQQGLWVIVRAEKGAFI